MPHGTMYLTVRLDGNLWDSVLAWGLSRKPDDAAKRAEANLALYAAQSEGTAKRAANAGWWSVSGSDGTVSGYLSWLPVSPEHGPQVDAAKGKWRVPFGSYRHLSLPELRTPKAHPILMMPA